MQDEEDEDVKGSSEEGGGLQKRLRSANRRNGAVEKVPVMMNRHQ